MTPRRIIVAILSLALIAVALWQLRSAEQGITATRMTIGDIPATAYQLPGGGKAPAVVIAHGFAGSQQLMKSFALSFARNGYLAITFDFAGHGRNPQGMSGDVNLIEGATRRLLEDVTKVAAKARTLGDGRIAVLGHSMASDIIVRFAESDPSVVATIAVSMFSPAVTAFAPRNLLMIDGEWEGTLKTEALRNVGLVSAPEPPQAGVTYGDFGAGTARRAAFSPHAEHASVLFNEVTMRESLAWLDESFGVTRQATPEIDSRGPWIVALLGGVVMLGWPLSSLLPRIQPLPMGAGLQWRRMWPGVLIPAVATPLLLRFVPTHFLPVLVGDYLAVHFFLYGLITCALLVWQGSWSKGEQAQQTAPASFLFALLAVVGYGFVGIVWPLDSFVTSFVPVGSRPMLVAVLFLGTLPYFLSDEWLTRGRGAARGAYAVTKVAFIISLAIAVELDPERLFFLIIIIPVVVPFFIVYGLLSRWSYAKTGHPLVAAVASALAFAWAIGVTFPLVTG
ncbi:MAG: alpha/beta fold hydrolase [Aestuariivirga sp.]